MRNPRKVAEQLLRARDRLRALEGMRRGIKRIICSARLELAVIQAERIAARNYYLSVKRELSEIGICISDKESKIKHANIKRLLD